MPLENECAYAKFNDGATFDGVSFFRNNGSLFSVSDEELTIRGFKFVTTGKNTAGGHKFIFSWNGKEIKDYYDGMKNDFGSAKVAARELEKGMKFALKSLFQELNGRISPEILDKIKTKVNQHIELDKTI